MYLNYKDFSFEISPETGAFQCFYSDPETGRLMPFLREGSMFVTGDGERYELSYYRTREEKIINELNGLRGVIFYSDGPPSVPKLRLTISINSETIAIQAIHRVLHLSGILDWGEDMEHSTFGVRLHSEEHMLRAACGPAVSNCDDALFDRLTDRALEFQTDGVLRVRYDWGKENYRLTYVSGLHFGRTLSFRVHRDFCRKKFNIPYAPITKTHGFQTPPVGWMSWNALQFDTSAELVLANAERLAALFSPLADKLCVWVDWEWNHASWDGEGIPGVDSFTPRPDVYPDGLAVVADRISELGLIPALWIGVTNEGQYCKSFQEHPDWVLGEKKDWCGRYWIDPTHPGIRDEYIPTVFRQILDYGFKIIKWDCLPATLNVCDALHDQLYDASVSSEMALRELVRVVRKIIGPDIYMLSCSGETERSICFAMDMFSAARVGGDVFDWDNFLNSVVSRIFHCYAWHNTVLYTDADTLVLRDEFNTLAQARSRVSFYGLAGLPVTLGDDLRYLPPERCNLLRCIMPTTDIHPMDLHYKKRGEKYGLLNLFVCREFGSWNVAGVTNYTNEPLRLALRLATDLHLAAYEKDGEGQTALFAVCDFWNRRFLGIFGTSIPLEIPPLDTAVLRVTPLHGVPEIIFTSRHITQGAMELRDVRRETDGTLSGIALCVPGEEWHMMLYIPETYEFLSMEASCPAETKREKEVLHVIFTPDSETEIRWILRFSPNPK